LRDWAPGVGTFVKEWTDMKKGNNNNNNNNNNKFLQSVCQFSAPSALDIQATDRLQVVLTMEIRYLSFLLEYLLKQSV
jgi:hypothetical protein